MGMVVFLTVRRYSLVGLCVRCAFKVGLMNVVSRVFQVRSVLSAIKHVRILSPLSRTRLALYFSDLDERLPPTRETKRSELFSVKI